MQGSVFDYFYEIIGIFIINIDDIKWIFEII